MAKGRPDIFNQEIADKICEIIATTTKSLRTICNDEDMPSVTTLLKWVRERKDFAEQYARAKEEQADMLIEEIIDIADDNSEDLLGEDKNGNKIENKEFVNRSRIRIDTRKWLASKLKPKKYGEKIEIDVKKGGLDKKEEEETYEP